MSQIVQDPELVTANAHLIRKYARDLINGNQQLPLVARETLVQIERLAREVEQEMGA